MSIEVIYLILRVLAGLSLAGFLLTLFIFIWHTTPQIDQNMQAAQTVHGYLVALPPADSPGRGGGERYVLHSVTSLGRSSSNSVVVNDDFASAEHAQIALEGGQWWLEDKGSRNGTRLNDEAIKERAVLVHGDMISIGQFSYRFELGGHLS